MRLFSFSFALVSFLCAACSGSDESPTASASAASSVDFCRSFCAKEATCDAKTDLDTCNAQCDRELGDTIAKMRADEAASVMTCWQGRDCRSLTPEHFKGCVQEARINTVPNDAARRFCDAFGEAAMKCDGAELNRAGCLGLAKSYSDAILDKATHCMTKSCTVLDDCLSATL
jgi:hypothetical protein